MVTKRISLKDFAKSELPELTKRAIEEQRFIVLDSILEALPEIVRISPVDTGLYAQSWSYEISENAITIGNSAPHAPVIELGARKFRPPIAPLLAWAKRVLQDPSQPPEYSPEVWRLAVGVQKKIELHGMAPRHIMQKGVDIVLDNIVRRLRL